ncbi:MAG: hypothetical protein WCL27_16055 [Betaproteobacteria bacterium]
MQKLIVTKGPKGTALDQARKIIGDESNEFSVGPVLARGQGNLPSWAGKNPQKLWALADETERSNGSAFRQYDLELPENLSVAESIALVKEFVRQEVGPKPFNWSIREVHNEDGNDCIVAQVMTSDRVQDGIKRRPDQFFRRYRTGNPSIGGCRKDGLGKLRGEVADPHVTRRRNWSNMVERAQSGVATQDTQSS